MEAPPLERAYLTLMRPVLEYASPTWDPRYDGDIKSVEMCQRRAARFVHKDHSWRSSVQTMLDKLEWPTLESRRENSRLVHFYNAVNENSGLRLPPYLQTSTRNPTKFVQPFSRIDLRRMSFFPRTVKKWNNTQQRVLPTTQLFKASLTQ